MNHPFERSEALVPRHREKIGLIGCSACGNVSRRDRRHRYSLELAKLSRAGQIERVFT
jgi:hypothetical protein